MLGVLDIHVRAVDVIGQCWIMIMKDISRSSQTDTFTDIQKEYEMCNASIIRRASQVIAFGQHALPVCCLRDHLIKIRDTIISLGHVGYLIMDLGECEVEPRPENQERKLQRHLRWQPE